LKKGNQTLEESKKKLKEEHETKFKKLKICKK